MSRWRLPIAPRPSEDAAWLLLTALLAVPIEVLPEAALDDWLAACAECLAPLVASHQDAAVDVWYQRLVRARLDHPTLDLCRQMARLVARAHAARGARRSAPSPVSS